MGSCREPPLPSPQLMCYNRVSCWGALHPPGQSLGAGEDAVHGSSSATQTVVRISNAPGDEIPSSPV